MGAENILITQYENDIMDAMKRIYSLIRRIPRLTMLVDGKGTGLIDTLNYSSMI